jgi:hypothetical protein
MGAVAALAKKAGIESSARRKLRAELAQARADSELGGIEELQAKHDEVLARETMRLGSRARGATPIYYGDRPPEVERQEAEQRANYEERSGYAQEIERIRHLRERGATRVRELEGLLGSEDAVAQGTAAIADGKRRAAGAQKSVGRLDEVIAELDRELTTTRESLATEEKADARGALEARVAGAVMPAASATVAELRARLQHLEATKSEATAQRESLIGEIKASRDSLVESRNQLTVALRRAAELRLMEALIDAGPALAAAAVGRADSRSPERTIEIAIDPELLERAVAEFRQALE